MDAQALIFQFDDVRVEVQNALVFKSGRRLSLEPKTFRVLVFLLEHQGRLIEKDELLAAVWADTFVTENTLARAIALLRKALGDTTGEPKYIETVPTRGYRFIATVTQEQSTQASYAAAVPETSPLPPAGRRKLLIRILAVMAATAAITATAALYFSSRNKQSLDTSELPSEFRSSQLTSSTALDIYPSFSPDGNTIAYCSNESGSFEIYLRQLTRGGSVVELTNDGARNLQPAWSPDGTTIAYYSQQRDGIWLIPALGGVARQLTTFGSSPAWSPDGTQIVFESEGPKDLNANASIAISTATLWIVPAKEGAPRQLTQVDQPNGAHNSPTWAPDGKSIAFITNGFKFPPALWTISLDGRNLQRIAEAGLFNPVYARDGRHMYVSSEFAIWEISLYGKKKDEHGPERRKIADALPEGPRYLTLSADGKKLAFSRVRTNSNIYLLPMSGDHPTGSAVALTHDTRFRKSGPVVSPNGRRVLFEVGSMDRNSGTWITDVDGKNASPVLAPCSGSGWLPGDQDFLCTTYVQQNGPECKENKCWTMDILKAQLAAGTPERVLHVDDDPDFVTFSRDGKQAAFMSVKNGPPNTWVASLEAGSAPRQVTFDSESMGWPAWSPDGKYLAVEQKRRDSTYIWIVKPGEPPIQLTHESGQNWPSSFSPDGDKIVFAANRGGVWNLWWVSRGNHSEKQLTFSRNSSQYVRYPNWSPDGKSMVYEYAETTGNIWMLELK